MKIKRHSAWYECVNELMVQGVQLAGEADRARKSATPWQIVLVSWKLM